MRNREDPRPRSTDTRKLEQLCDAKGNYEGVLFNNRVYKAPEEDLEYIFKMFKESVAKNDPVEFLMDLQGYPNYGIGFFDTLEEV
jgi:hypothetical protein